MWTTREIEQPVKPPPPKLEVAKKKKRDIQRPPRFALAVSLVGVLLVITAVAIISVVAAIFVAGVFALVGGITVDWERLL